ncbi:MAG: type III glutamate--ammonia ligase, partial [Planctomycetaceae bacterium]|nr:type III glutamate--ammonia ligase [Planctomycetaceae bacterium]
MSDREDLRKRLKQEQIEFLLVQFVDIHGGAKAKMVPAACLDDVLDVGAGFAGGA